MEEDEIEQLTRELETSMSAMKGGSGKKAPPPIDTTDTEIKYTAAGETVLAQMSEKASAFRWLHHQCSNKYKKLDARFQLPVIIISSLTGGISLSLGSMVPEEQQTVAQTAVGTLNLIVGIISSVAQFTKAASLAEGHRAASISWGRLARRLQIELALEPHLRSEDQDSLIKSSISTYDNLCEQGPIIDTKVINAFKAQFGVDPPEPNISRPEIISGPYRVKIFGRHEGLSPPARRTSGLWSKGLRALGMGRKKTATTPSSDSSTVIT